MILLIKQIAYIASAAIMHLVMACENGDLMHSKTMITLRDGEFDISSSDSEELDEKEVRRQTLKLPLSSESSKDCGLQAMAYDAKHHLLATLTDSDVVQLREDTDKLRVLRSVNLLDPLFSLGLESQSLTFAHFQVSPYIYLGRGKMLALLLLKSMKCK